MVSAIIVNYFSSSLTQRAATSIINNQVKSEIFVVDNSCDTYEEKTLKSSLPEGVNLLINNTNEGFARACNRAYEKCRGRYILLLNPDAYLLDDALEQLCLFLDNNEKAGAVGPKTYWDNDKTFILPPNHIPNPLYDALYSGQRRIPFFSKFFYLRWRYHAIKSALATEPLLQDCLSGGGVLLKKDAITKAGGLFDESFFLYYEDTDLFIRIKRAGFQLYMEPSAKMVHHWNQSPEPHTTKEILRAKSHDLFIKKYYKQKPFIKVFVNNLFSFFKDNRNDKHIPFYSISDLTSGITLSTSKKYLFEWSPNKSLFPAMMFFAEGKIFRFNRETLSLLKKGTYYGRFSEPYSFFVSNNIFQWRID